tara:strand:- start:851 stop:1255 length:405 start_codon:yes stop_codon:yes gene_type:complete
MQRKITLPQSVQQEVKRLCSEGNKIAAIKLVRNEGKAFPPDHSRSDPRSIGLKEAKHAVEHAYNPTFLQDTIPCAVFGAGFKVRKLIVEIAGEGDVELDIEEMQMRFLQELKTLGLPQVQHLLNLTEYIEEWQR